MQCVFRDCLVKTALGVGAAFVGLWLAGALDQGFASAGEVAADPGLTPKQLRCEYLVNPAGIDELHPRLSWVVESGERGQRQTAYQVLVASDEAFSGKDRGDLWDSGKVAGDETTGIVYGGKALASRQRCFWRSKCGTRTARRQRGASRQCGPWRCSSREIGKRNTSVSATRRRCTGRAAAVPAAGAAVSQGVCGGQTGPPRDDIRTALGIYELHLNGERVGDALFAPGWSDYHQRAYYNTYDVTALVKNGANALGAWVADGWYSGYIGFGLLTGIGTEAIGR